MYGADIRTIIAMAQMLSGSSDFLNMPAYKDPLNGIDIYKEYELIKQKKSYLSARKRQMVVNRVERIRAEEREQILKRVKQRQWEVDVIIEEFKQAQIFLDVAKSRGITIVQKRNNFFCSDT